MRVVWTLSKEGKDMISLWNPIISEVTERETGFTYFSSIFSVCTRYILLQVTSQLTVFFLIGSLQFPVRSGTDAPGVLQGNPRRQGLRTVMEEVHLQDNLQTRRPCTRIFQVAQLSGATGITTGVARGSWRAPPPRHAAFRVQPGLLLHQRVLTTSTHDNTRLLPFSYSCLSFLFFCAKYAAVSLPLSFTSSWLTAKRSLRLCH